MFVMNHYNIAKEEMAFYGGDCTSLQNLLAIIIGPKATSEVTGKLASLGIRELATLSKEDLLKFDGVGELTATRITTAFELGKQLLSYKNKDVEIIRSPEDAAKLFEDLSIHNQEHFVAIYLNTKNHVLKKKTITIGSLNASIVHPREVYSEAIKIGAASVVVAHNHPSGDTYPSREDIDVTRRLSEAGKIMGIDLLDHIVIGQGNFTSLKEKGYC